MKTLFINADTGIALHAESFGVDVIFIDMEIHGKAERQGHLDTHKADHSRHDAGALPRVMRKAELMVRINLPWEGTARELAGAISSEATRMMLPMFNHVAEVAQIKAMRPSRSMPRQIRRWRAYLDEMRSADKQND